MDPTPYHHPNFSLCSYLVSRLHWTLPTLGLLLTLSVTLPVECFLSTYKSSRLVSDLYPVSTESRLLSFPGDLVFSETFVLSCGCRALQLSSKRLEITARTQFSPLSPQCLVKGRGPLTWQIPVAVSLEMTTLTLICFPSGQAPVYLRFPQKFHPECTK